MSGNEGADAQAIAQEVVQAGNLRSFELVLGLICCILMLLIVGLTFVEVFMRYLFAKPIRGAEEIIQFAMATMIFAALPMITARRGHVTVSLIENAVKGGFKRLVDVVVDLCSLAAVTLISWRLFVDAGGRIESGDATVVLNWPRAPLVYVMAALAAITAVVQLGMLWKRLSGANR